MKYATLLIIPLLLLGGATMSQAELSIDPQKDFIEFPEDLQPVFLSEPNQARFSRVRNGWTWISDIEHVIEEHTHEIFLADATKPYYLAGDRIPAGKFFELFPYHYYDKEEEQRLGGRIKYKLIVKNVSSEAVTVDLTGIGTTTDWNHFQTWQGALRGDGAKSFSLAPGEIRTLWEEKALEGGLPWSGIVLGKASGDIWVCDYAYLGDQDPGIEDAQPMPDLAWPPYLLASFTRGSCDWNTARVDLFPEQRDAEGSIPLSLLKEPLYSVAIAYSPGGPITNLCKYKAVEPTFAEDRLEAKDPLSGKSHVFFGGNYPIMYKMAVPIVNDTTSAKTFNVSLCSNDVYNVDTIAGVWIGGQMLHRRVPVLGKDQQWKVAALTLEPGRRDTVEMILIPLGSRWGGMIASIGVTSPGSGDANLQSAAEPPSVESRVSPFGLKMDPYWIDRAKAFVKNNPTRSPGGVVFLGDSLTERYPVEKLFPGAGIINRGIGGDRIEGVLTRMDLSVYDLKPGKLFLQIGINDLLFPRADLEELKRRYGLLLNKLKKNCPETQIYVQTLLPLAGQFAGHNKEVLQLNRDIRKLTKGHRFQLIDLHPHFLGENGQLQAEDTIDGVHLSESAYERWANLLKPYLNQD